jgi:SAM-dependent methyltransferase
MLGTDQRDLFVPILKRQSIAIRDYDTIIDFGCGDGQTTRFLWDRINRECSVTLLDPNAPYLAAHKEYLSKNSKIMLRDALNITLDDWVRATKPKQKPVAPADVGLALILHSLYFTTDLAEFLQQVLNVLRDRGRAMIVLSDELNGYTSVVMRAYVKAYAAPNNAYTKGVKGRRALFGIKRDSGISVQLTQRSLEAHLNRTDFTVKFAARQESRIYGNEFSDIIAASFISSLNDVSDHPIANKITFVAELLRQRPDLIDLSLEISGPRKRMISVAQPQFVIIIQKSSKA